ncbi:MAG: hypothetical protein KF899_12740 [Parvibaculum sp.]|nr:hypothetical protein [Parvibaculum sp.]
MTIASPSQSQSAHLSYAVIAAGTIVAIALVVTALMGPDRGTRLIANPQGGIWVQKGNSLFLCRASTNGAAPCVNLTDGSALSFADIAR